MANMFSNLVVKGLLVNRNLKETIDEKTGVVTKTNYLYFMMNNQKGLENVKVKDAELQFLSLEIGKVVEIPIRVTMSSMGQTFYEVANEIKLDFK